MFTDVMSLSLIIIWIALCIAYGNAAFAEEARIISDRDGRG